MTNEAAVEPPEEIDDFDEVNETVAATFSITSYGADYPVDGLVKRIDQDDIVIPIFDADPAEGQTAVGFQREFVWRKPQADRFVESLLLGLPVPGIFLVKEANGKHLVLDGHQRLKTLASFYRGIMGSSTAIDSWPSRTMVTITPASLIEVRPSVTTTATITGAACRGSEPAPDITLAPISALVSAFNIGPSATTDYR